jgi:hypothetical protein
MLKTSPVLLQDNYSERTQISLSPSLRRIIDTKRILTKESLSEYIRNALTMRLSVEEKGVKRRRQAARVFVGSINRDKHPEWRTENNVLIWQKRIRREK